MESRWRASGFSSPSIILIFLLLLIGPGISAQESYERSAEFRIAHGYYQQALQLYREGRYRSAADLLDVSLEFFPGYSQSALLYARIYLREQKTTWKAIEMLETAVRSGTWTDTEPLTAVVELARLYIRTSRYGEARRSILQTGETGLGGRGNPELSALWAASLIGLGNLGEAQLFLSAAVRRFPGSLPLYTRFAEVLIRRGSREAARDVLLQGIREMPEEAELLYRLAALEPEPGRRRDLVRRYIRIGGTDPGAALLAVVSGVQEQQEFIELFFRLGGNARIGYLDTLQEFLGGAQIPQFSGTRVLDENRDGYYEQRYEYEKGILQMWIADLDQNGVAEATVLFENGNPRVLALSAPGGFEDLQYRYSEYPYAESAVVRYGAEGSRREYRLVPYTVRRPCFAAFPPQGYALEFRPDVRAQEDFLRRNSYQFEEFSGEDTLALRRVHLMDGRITRVEEIPDSRGNFTRTIFFAASLPVSGIRDLDGDGNPEIREEFRDGRLWKIGLDQDSDGVMEFEQITEGESIRMYWDYNDDGLYDSRESAQANGALVRDFSSRLDGTFDLTTSGASR